MLPSPKETTSADTLCVQTNEVLQRSQQLRLIFQQVREETLQIRADACQTRRWASEQRFRSRQLREDLHLQRQRLTALRDTLSVPRCLPRPPASLKRLAPETLDDLALIEVCKTGDSRAWNALVRRLEPMIYSFARTLCGNTTDAADITSEVYLCLFTSLHTFRRGAPSFNSWLFKIVRNTYVDVCIRDSDHGHLSLDAPIDPEEPRDSHEVLDPKPTPELLCLDNDQLERLAEGVRTLPAYQRQVLTLFLKGRSYEQITQETGLSMGTVKSRLNRARKTLQERLQDGERLPGISKLGGRRVKQPA